jgi:hypothetical protein
MQQSSVRVQAGSPAAGAAGSRRDRPGTNDARYARGVRRSSPPMYGRSAAGMATVPSASW